MGRGKPGKGGAWEWRVKGRSLGMEGEREEPGKGGEREEPGKGGEREEPGKGGERGVEGGWKGGAWEGGWKGGAWEGGWKGGAWEGGWKGGAWEVLVAGLTAYFGYEAKTDYGLPSCTLKTNLHLLAAEWEH